jgi:hypothetical protein
MEFDARKKSGKDALIAARYYGLDGLGGETSRDPGKALGVTREILKTNPILSSGPRRADEINSRHATAIHFAIA